MPVVEVTQYKQTVHVPKDVLREIVSDYDFSKSELKVIMYLLTVLSGFKMDNDRSRKDPKNFTAIDVKQVSKKTGIDKEKIKMSIERLIDLGLVEKGSSPSIKTGYRFRF